MIAITGFERFKGGLRVEFVCGARALHAYRALQNTVDGSVRLLSVLPDELPSAIEKLQTASRTQQKAQEALQERLAVPETKPCRFRREDRQCDRRAPSCPAGTPWD
jgi:alanyl-tRNA synthetase